MQKNQLWLLGGVIVVVAIIIAVVVSNNSTNTSSNTASTATKNNVYQEKKSASVGGYLTDPKGNTLYTYDKDKSGVSYCDAECLKTWPVYGPTASESLPANLTVIKRSDGTQQFAYKGQPLYYFVSDTAPGAILGNGFNGFHVAKL